MSEFFNMISQIVIGLFTLIPLTRSFQHLGVCTKCTPHLLRLAYALLFTSSVGVLLAIMGGAYISGWCALLIIGIALQMLSSPPQTTPVR